MPKNSLGQFRIYEYECDECGAKDRVEVRGNARTKYPTALGGRRWRPIVVTTGGEQREGFVCSNECAGAWACANATVAEPDPVPEA